MKRTRMVLRTASLPVFTLLFLILLLSVLLLVAGAAPAGHTKYLVYVGTYTQDEGKATPSKGIYVLSYEVGSAQDAAPRVTPLGLAAETTNPSWVALSPNGRFLYAVNEVGDYKGPNSGGLSAFSIDRATGKLTFLNEVSTRGADPCYVTVDRTGKFVLVANYTGGSVIVFRVDKDGKLGEASDFLQHQGHGTDPKRQEGPHAHSIDLSPDNRLAYVDDLGLNELQVNKFDATKGGLTMNIPPVDLNPGAGPRHFALHPNGKFAYVVSEMSGTVTVFSNDARTGTLHSLQTISTLPKDYSGAIEDAEIKVHPSGKFLYASNRGDASSIAVFAIDPTKGTLTTVEITPTQGKTPRSFEIDPTGTFLLAANQKSDNIVIFRIDQETGKLTPAGKVLDVGAPVCVKFLALD